MIEIKNLTTVIITIILSILLAFVSFTGGASEAYLFLWTGCERQNDLHRIDGMVAGRLFGADFNGNANAPPTQSTRAITGHRKP